MKTKLLFTEIEKRFDSHWVLLGNPRVDENLKIQSAEILCFSKNRDDVYQKARKLQPRHSAILYIGHPSSDIAIIL